MKRSSFYLTLLVVVGVTGLLLGTPNLQNAADQPMILAQSRTLVTPNPPAPPQQVQMHRATTMVPPQPPPRRITVPPQPRNDIPRHQPTLPKDRAGWRYN
jgi:hypothetical protein